ncbi:MAG: HNH endonuclease [Bacteroidetes bacterium]|nr:HNH endonuclease [Bacteroidota bacterium]
MEGISSLALEQTNGYIPKGMILRFKNGDSLEVRLDNLMLITMAKNSLLNTPEDFHSTHNAAINLTDKYVASMLSHRDRRLRKELLKRPETIELKRQQLLLRRQINAAKNKLLQMIGSSYMYKARTHKIIATRIKEESVFISTDLDLIELNINDCEKIIHNDFLPAESGSPQETESAPVLYQEIKSAGLITDLKSNIDQLKQDPSYIKQAMAINSTVKTMLDIVKTELQIKKAGGKS